MKTDCDRSSIFDSPSADFECLVDENHIAECCHCAELLDGHRKLTIAFQGEPRNSPSIHFDRELRNRLRDEQQYQRRTRLRLTAMRTYWLLTALASLIIVWLVPWTVPTVSTPVLLSLGVFLGLTVIVPSLLYRSLRFG
jgi:hypothetical protein